MAGYSWWIWFDGDVQRLAVGIGGFRASRSVARANVVALAL